MSAIQPDVPRSATPTVFDPFTGPLISMAQRGTSSDTLASIMLR
jgi:hypothetical protein